MVIGNDYLDAMELALQDADLPLSQELSSYPYKGSSLLELFSGDPLLAYGSIRKTFGRRVAESRAIQITLALDADPGSADRDQWPVEYLTSIGIPASATVDPFDDQPMRIKRENGQWNVYSCGRDRNDDGAVKYLDCGVSSVYRD
jgi:hypothetical protein